jgi:hypothetical protein
VVEAIDNAAEDVEDVFDSDGPAKPERSKAAVDGGASEAERDSAAGGSATSDHETYMFGKYHVFLD